MSEQGIAEIDPRDRLPRNARKLVRTPVSQQLEAVECGAVSLRIVLAHFGRWVSLEELREACCVGRDGSTMRDIATAAEKFGLVAQGWRRETRQLRQLRVPLILHWDFKHFLVLEGYKNGTYYVNDPANGRRTVSEEEFDQSFTGVVLECEPGPDFQRGGTRPGMLRRVIPWLREVKGALVLAALCGMMLMLGGLAMPVILSLFVERVIRGGERVLGDALVGAMFASGALMYLLTWQQRTTFNKLSIRLSVTKANEFMTRILKLPVQYFAYRLVGDLIGRIQLIDNIASISASHLASVVIEISMGVFFFALIFLLDPLMASAVGVLALVCGWLVRKGALAGTDHNQRMRREQGRLAGIWMAGLRSIGRIRANSSEGRLYARLAGHQARELRARQEFMEMGYLVGALPSTFLVLGSAAVLGVGGWRVLSGDLTLGALVGIYFAAGALLNPISRFMQFVGLFQMLDVDLQRLDDVLKAEPDKALVAEPAPKSTRLKTVDGRLKLAGRVELRNVTFGFHRNREPLIKDFSVTIEPGQRVAVVGGSGSGKSTLAMLAAGLYLPWSGEILIDGQERRSIPREVLASSVSFVDQHNFIFAGTVRENLTMWDSTIPDEWLVAAATDAQIHGEIIERVGGYDSPVLEGGKNFSGGQRQRLEIARALVSKPSVLILDEASSALDNHVEAQIDNSLRRRNCSCLVVAHRLSTIRDCDLIVVLESGRDVQRGTHEQLIADEGGLYHKLCSPQ